MFRYIDDEGQFWDYPDETPKEMLPKNMKLLTGVDLELALNPKKTQDQLDLEFRFKRNELIVEADILINKAEDNSQDSTKLRAYRQALRDSTINWILPKLSDYL